ANTLIFPRASALMAQPFDPLKRRLIGEPEPIAEGRQLEFSASSIALAYHSSPDPNRELLWFDRSGRAVSRVGDPGVYGDLSMSPDGRQIAEVRHDGGDQNIWLRDLQRGVAMRLTFGHRSAGSPVWSPDGSRILYVANDGHSAVYQTLANGAGGGQI